MVKYIKEFQSFVDLVKLMPLTLNISSRNNVELVLKGEVPYISDEELEKIILFTHKGFSKSLLDSRHERENEIEENLFNLEGSVLKKYLTLIKESLSEELKRLRWIRHLKKLQNSNSIELYKEKSNSLTKIQKANFICINLFYDTLLDCYDCCHKLNDYILQKEKTLNNIQNGNPLNEPTNIFSDKKLNVNYVPKTLKSLFEDESIYNALIEFMVKEELILKGELLIWKSKKFEISTFQEALYDQSLINQKVNDNDLKLLAENTFKDFMVSTRTLSEKYPNTSKSFNNFREMLIRFKQSLA